RSLETRPTLAWLLYFACLGAGFIIVEVTLVQKTILFLGHPVYALTVVLFALLIFSAIGSRISGRIAEADLRTRLPALLGAVALLVLLSVWLLSPLYDLLV